MTAPLDIAALRGLLERLRATVHRGKFTLGGGSIGHDGKGTMWGGERIMEQANPDGNQAATAIEALLARVAELEGALRSMLGDGGTGRTWREAAEPLIARFTIAGKFDANAVHNGEGAKAIAELMGAMADKLDNSIASARATLTKEPTVERTAK